MISKNYSPYSRNDKEVEIMGYKLRKPKYRLKPEITDKLSDKTKFVKKHEDAFVKGGVTFVSTVAAALVKKKLIK